MKSVSCRPAVHPELRRACERVAAQLVTTALRNALSDAERGLNAALASAPVVVAHPSRPETSFQKDPNTTEVVNVGVGPSTSTSEFISVVAEGVELPSDSGSQTQWEVTTDSNVSKVGEHLMSPTRILPESTNQRVSIPTSDDQNIADEEKG